MNSLSATLDLKPQEQEKLNIVQLATSEEKIPYIMNYYKTRTIYTPP